MIPMAFHYGLHPWDINRLTIFEFEIYKAGLEEMVRQNKQAAEGNLRPPRRR